MSVSELDLARYDRIVNGLYESAVDSTKWGCALEYLQDLFASNYVTLILRVPDTRDLGLMISVGNLEGGGRVAYMTYQHSASPFVNQPPGKIFVVDDLMDEAQWRRSSYYLHWCKPRDVFHVMGVDIPSPAGSGKLRFRVTRPESAPAFSEEDKRLCAVLLPHLTRSLYIHNSIHRSESLSSMYLQAIARLSVATVVLDEQGAIIDQNLIARDLLSAGDGLKVVGGRLEASFPSDNRDLRKLIQNALAVRAKPTLAMAEAMSISRPSGNPHLGVVVEPMPPSEWAEGKGQPAAVVYVRDAAGKTVTSAAAARQLFNLTPAETTLALELANGLSLEEAAEALDIRRNTARAHLRSIFSKTGVRRQTELVRIILNSVAALSKER